MKIENENCYETKVSIIIPVYNTEKYLEVCLDSLLKQTFKDFEIICVDDGSNDSSCTLISSYIERDSRISLLKQKNQGGGAARNLGMKKAVGEYLLFLDSDDYFEANMLEKFIDKMDSTVCDICVSKMRFWHEDLGYYTEEAWTLREQFIPKSEVFNYHDMSAYIFNTFQNWPWNKMFRHSFVKKNNLKFQEIKRTNDLFFSCKALVEADKISVLPEVLINYRVGMKGNCQSTNYVASEDFFKAFYKLKNYLIDKDIYNEVRQSFVNHALDGCIANLLSIENHEEQESLYHRLKNEFFIQLDIVGNSRDYFYSIYQERYEYFCVIMNFDYKYFLRYRIQCLKLTCDEAYISKNDMYKSREVAYLEIERYKNEMKSKTEETLLLEKNIQKKEIALKEYQQEIQEVYQSYSYRVGYIILMPMRMGKDILGKVKRLKKKKRK